MRVGPARRTARAAVPARGPAGPARAAARGPGRRRSVGPELPAGRRRRAPGPRRGRSPSRSSRRGRSLIRPPPTGASAARHGCPRRGCPARRARREAGRSAAHSRAALAATRASSSEASSGSSASAGVRQDRRARCPGRAAASSDRDRHRPSRSTAPPRRRFASRTSSKTRGQRRRHVEIVVEGRLERRPRPVQQVRQRRVVGARPPRSHRGPPGACRAARRRPPRPPAPSSL